MRIFRFSFHQTCQQIHLHSCNPGTENTSPAERDTDRHHPSSEMKWAFVRWMPHHGAINHEIHCSRRVKAAPMAGQPIVQFATFTSQMQGAQWNVNSSWITSPNTIKCRRTTYTWYLIIILTSRSSGIPAVWLDLNEPLVMAAAAVAPIANWIVAARARDLRHGAPITKWGAAQGGRAHQCDYQSNARFVRRLDTLGKSRAARQGRTWSPNPIYDARISKKKREEDNIK